MPIRFNRVPWGLRSLLDLSALESPRTIGDSVQASIDVSDLFRLTSREIRTGQAGPLAAGPAIYVDSSADPVTGLPFTQVPEGELWYVHEYTLTTTVVLTGATKFQMYPGYRPAGTTSDLIVANMALNNWSASDIPWQKSDHPFWMKAGDVGIVVIGQATALGAAFPDVIQRMQITRYRI